MSFVFEVIEVMMWWDWVGFGDCVEIVVCICDEVFFEINWVNVVVDVILLSGVVILVLFEWLVEEDGCFEGMFFVDEFGFYEVVVDVSLVDGILGIGMVIFEVVDFGDEYFGV